jgi:hypothetical protein
MLLLRRADVDPTASIRAPRRAALLPAPRRASNWTERVETPAAFALAMPSSWRSRRRLVSRTRPRPPRSQSYDEFVSGGLGRASGHRKSCLAYRVPDSLTPRRICPALNWIKVLSRICYSTRALSGPNEIPRMKFRDTNTKSRLVCSGSPAWSAGQCLPMRLSAMSYVASARRSRTPRPST